jgi:3-hydroxymyristoyl/3-hydroxydecanoyl-(acyl carrier protein) dehydratase
MAQASAILLMSTPEYANTVPLIGAIDGVKFRRPVTPGDQLISHIEVQWVRGPIGKFTAKATVDGEVVASMEMTFKLAPRS